MKINFFLSDHVLLTTFTQHSCQGSSFQFAAIHKSRVWKSISGEMKDLLMEGNLTLSQETA
jgi:hypothetical protein